MSTTLGVSFIVPAVITSKPLNESFDKFSVVVKHSLYLSASAGVPLSILLGGTQHSRCVGVGCFFPRCQDKGRFIHLRYRKYLKV